MALLRRSDRFGLSVYALIAHNFATPNFNACVCRIRHTHALTPFQRSRPPAATMAAYAASASGLLQSTHVYNNRLTPTVLASNTHAHDLRTVWHGLRAITTHTVPPSVVVSVPHYNGTIPRGLRRSKLRAVTFDARFSVYRTPKIEEQATAPGHPPPAGLEDARPPDRPSN